MKILICKYNFFVLLTSYLLFLHTGCVTHTTTYTLPVPTEPVDYRQATDWQVDNSNLDVNAKTSFSISTDKIIESVHKLVIKGVITSCYYSYVPSQSRKVPMQYYDKTRRMWIQSWKVESQVLSTERKNWMPDSVRISNPFGGTEIADVSEKGEFKVFFELPHHYFLQLPRPDNYLMPAKTTNQYAINITAVNPPHGGNFITTDLIPSIWQYVLDIDKAKRYAKENICEVSLKFKDATSRRSIMPKVIITGLEPSKDDIHSVLSDEFNGNQDLIEAASDGIYDVLFEGSEKTSITDSMSFRAWIGGRYKIEAIHGKYYYFSSGLEPDSKGKIKKDILLVEKGSKVRLEQSNEGEVGTMIDSD